MPWPCQAGAGQRLDSPAQLLGVLAADRDPTGRRPQGGGDHVSSAGIALVVAQERPGEQREELGQQSLSPLVIRERPRKQGVVEEGTAERGADLGKVVWAALRTLSATSMQASLHRPSRASRA
jgi:hypothetical protein